MVEATESKIIELCLSGDSEAFGRLVEKYQKQVFNAALRIVGDYDEAHDIAQTVFIKAFEKLHTYDPRFKFFSWIYRMTVNESINSLARSKRTETLPANLVAQERGPEEQAAAKQLSALVQRGIMELSVHYRVVIVLRHFRQLSYQEISQVLAIEEKTVKSRLFTARQLLCEIFRKRGIVGNG